MRHRSPPPEEVTDPAPLEDEPEQLSGQNYVMRMATIVLLTLCIILVLIVLVDSYISLIHDQHVQVPILQPIITALLELIKLVKG